MKNSNPILNALIKACIEIRGNKAFDGSYAAPREAYRKILTQAFHAGEAQGADWAVDMIKTDSLFAREDVHDGNEGHYRVSQKTLEAARQGDNEKNV